MKNLQQEVDKARSVAEQWEAKAAQARADGAELDANSGSAILDNPAAAEQITIKVQAKEREARAYDAAAVEAQQRVVGVYRRHLEDEAAALDKQAAQAKRDADKHQAKVQALVDQLTELEGVKYTPDEEWQEGDGGQWRPIPKSEELRDKETDALDQAGLIRFYLAHGHMPTALDSYRSVEPGEVLLEVMGSGVEL